VLFLFKNTAMIKWILRILGILLVTLLLLSIIAPTEQNITKSIVINSPARLIHNEINDLSRWSNWSPWDKMDPKMVKTMGAKYVGEGASYTWKGPKAGEGSMLITQSNADSIRSTLKFGWGEPASCQFVFSNEGAGTKVTWNMQFKTPFPWNAFSMIMGFDKSIGKDFESGLAALKTIGEQKAVDAAKYGGYSIQEKDLPEVVYAYKREVVSMQNIAKYFGQSYPILGKSIGMAGAKVSGPASGLYFMWDAKKKITDMAAALPIDKSIILNGSGLGTISLKGKALVLDHYGAYELTANAHYALDTYKKEKMLASKEPVVEQYITDPMVEKDTAKWLTRLIYFLK